MHHVKTIYQPVDPNGHVLKSDTDIETIEYGTKTLTGHGRGIKHRVPEIAIEIAQHTDGLWMWSASGMIRGAYRGYRVGEKWGKFAHTREDAIAVLEAEESR